MNSFAKFDLIFLDSAADQILKENPQRVEVLIIPVMGNCFVGEMRNEEKSDSGALFDGNVEKLNVAILKARIKEIAGKLPVRISCWYQGRKCFGEFKSEYQRSFKKENYSEMLTCIESVSDDKLSSITELIFNKREGLNF